MGSALAENYLAVSSNTHTHTTHSVSFKAQAGLTVEGCGGGVIAAVWGSGCSGLWLNVNHHTVIAARADAVCVWQSGGGKVVTLDGWQTTAHTAERHSWHVSLSVFWVKAIFMEHYTNVRRFFFMNLCRCFQTTMLLRNLCGEMWWFKCVLPLKNNH